MVAYLPKVISARERSSVVGKVLGLVAGGDVEGACDNLQVCQDQLPGFLFISKEYLFKLGNKYLPTILVLKK